MRNGKINDSEFKGIINSFKRNIDNLVEDLDIKIHESIAIDISIKTIEFRNCNFKRERIDFFQDNSRVLEVLDIPGAKKSVKTHKTFLKFENCTYKIT